MQNDEYRTSLDTLMEKVYGSKPKKKINIFIFLIKLILRFIIKILILISTILWPLVKILIYLLKKIPDFKDWEIDTPTEFVFFFFIFLILYIPLYILSFISMLSDIIFNFKKKPKE